jgi:type IV pilus assembly protein PilQ
MRTWKRNVWLLFLAAASVYYSQAIPEVMAVVANNEGGAIQPDLAANTPVNWAAVSAPAPASLTAAPATPAASATAVALATPVAAAPRTEAPAVASAPADPPAATTQPDALPEKPAASPQISVSSSGISIQTSNNEPLVDVLREIGEAAQISIVPSEQVSGKVPAMGLYNVSVDQAIQAVLESNGCEYERKGSIIYVYSHSEWAAMQKKNVETDVYRLYYISAQDAEALIKPHLSADGIISVTPAALATITGGTNSSGSSGSSSGGSGGSSSGATGGNNYANEDMLVITDHPSVQREVAKIIKQIDQRPQQVLVEATILEVELTQSNSLGVNLTALGSINFSDLGSLGGAIPSGTSSILSGAPIANSSKGFNSVQTGNGGLQVGVVQDNIAVFLNALESVTNTTILSNPKVLTLDKQEGKVHVGETIYYEGSSTQTATSNTATVSSLDTGITLDFRPYICDDGYIRMEIDPSDSNPVGTGNATLGLPPNINANEVTSNILVKDGHTVVIGGLFVDNDSTGRGQVPFFGDLPLAGPLFGQQNDSTDRREIIFLLTPHIVKDQNVYSDMSNGVRKDMERYRVGVREDMLPWGRERLADLCYEEARSELRKPHPDLNLVRWHLDCATNLNPLFLEAIKLKEKVTGQVVETADNSSIRSFVRREMMEAQRQSALQQLEAVPPKVVRVSAPPATQPAGGE